MALHQLPLEGSTFKQLTVYGNAKDCEMTISTEDPDFEVQFLMRDPDVQLDIQGRVKSSIFERGDDPYLGVEYVPLEKLKLQKCVVDYEEEEGDEYGWQEIVEWIRQGRKDPIGWMIDGARLEINLCRVEDKDFFSLDQEITQMQVFLKDTFFV